MDFEREELFSAGSNLGLRQFESERLSETGIFDGTRYRDELFSNSVVETKYPIREHGSPVLTGAI